MNEPKQTYSVSVRTKSRAIGKELERLVMSAGGFRPAESDERPDLLIFEPDEDAGQDFQTIEKMLASNTVGEVFVTAKNQDADLLIKAMRAGRQEFL